MLDDPYVQVALQAPPSPYYIPGPEEPQSPPLPDFVPEPVYPEYMPQEDEVFPAEEQPLPVAAIPTAQSPDYVSESDTKEDPKEEDDEDPEEDPVDYPADGGDDSDDEDESSRDDKDDDGDIEADDDEEEEYPAPADSTSVVLSVADQAPYTISILALVPTLVWSNAEVARLLAISTPTSSPLSLWSSPLTQIAFLPLPPIPSPSLPLSPPLPALSTSHSLLLPSTYHLTPPSGTPSLSLIPAPTSSPPLLLPSTNRKEDRLEVTLPPRKRLGIALGPRYKVKERSSAAARPAG
ncbi:hypothetical protein Tco_1261912, partial [Tanacetum coccineum]